MKTLPWWAAAALVLVGLALVPRAVNALADHHVCRRDEAWATRAATRVQALAHRGPLRPLPDRRLDVWVSATDVLLDSRRIDWDGEAERNTPGSVFSHHKRPEGAWRRARVSARTRYADLEPPLDWDSVVGRLPNPALDTLTALHTAVVVHVDARRPWTEHALLWRDLSSAFSAEGNTLSFVWQKEQQRGTRDTPRYGRDGLIVAITGAFLGLQLVPTTPEAPPQFWACQRLDCTDVVVQPDFQAALTQRREAHQVEVGLAQYTGHPLTAAQAYPLFEALEALGPTFARGYPIAVPAAAPWWGEAD